MTRSLPVLLYHYISQAQGAIAVSPQRFRDHCRAMAQAGWRGVGLAEAAAYLLHGAPLPRKSVLITFDDGFLDNVVHALPSLREFGHKATVFAVAQRLELESQRLEAPGGLDGRPTVDQPFVPDALGHPQRRDLFMSWEQARAAEAAGVLDIAAHSLTHAPVWDAPPPELPHLPPERWELVRPGPRNRTFDRPCLPEYRGLPWGLPRLPERPGLTHRAFLPSVELTDLPLSLVPQDLGAAAEWLADPRCVAELVRRYVALPLERWGRLESPEEYQARVRADLAGCRELLARNLVAGAPLVRDCLAWPWGKSTPEVLHIAKEVGYRVFFQTSFGANRPGARPEHVHRFKARDKAPAWLLSRLWLYARPFWADLYARLRI